MIRIAERTRFVHGFDASGAKLDPSPYTARGVYAGICAALEHVFGDADPGGHSVLVQGVGNVGYRLAEELAAAGARVLVSDLDEERAGAVAAELGGDAIGGVPGRHAGMKGEPKQRVFVERARGGRVEDSGVDRRLPQRRWPYRRRCSTSSPTAGVWSSPLARRTTSGSCYTAALAISSRTRSSTVFGSSRYREDADSKSWKRFGEFLSEVSR